MIFSQIYIATKLTHPLNSTFQPSNIGIDICSTVFTPNGIYVFSKRYLWHWFFTKSITTKWFYLNCERNGRFFKQLVGVWKEVNIDGQQAAVTVEESVVNTRVISYLRGDALFTLVCTAVMELWVLSGLRLLILVVII
jgi:hypothetical protein